MNKSNLFKTIFLILSGALTGALQVWLNLPYLIFLSLIPLLIYVYTSSSKKEYKSIIIKFFMPYYFVQSAFLLTIYKLMPLSTVFAIPIAIIGTIALTLWLFIIMFMPLWFYPYLKRNSPVDLLIFSLLFIVGEWLSEIVPVLPFSWSGIWLALISKTKIIQTASLLGCHFVSLIILILASCLTLMLLNIKNQKSYGYALIFTSIFILNFAFGETHIEKIQNDISKINSTKVMIAQDNIEGSDKNHISSDKAATSYISIMNDNWEDNIDFVLLPETAIPCDYNCNKKPFKRLTNFAKNHDTTLITGCFYNDNSKTYNAMFSVTDKGFCSCPYLKQVLVPFGEKLPFSSDSLTSAEPTKNHELLCENNCKIANIICIESIYPSLTRKQILNGAEILCVSTNDSWFGKSYAKYAHFRHTIMRAVESGKYTLRSGNCGISAVITPYGEPIYTITQAKKDAIVTDIKAISGKNLYTYVGDIIILPGCIMILTVIFKLLKKKYI